MAIITLNRNTYRALAIIAPMVAAFEGGRTVAYRDPVGIPTVCFGATVIDGRPVLMGDTATQLECEQHLTADLLAALHAVQACSTAELPPHRLAAYASLAYNVGPRVVCDARYSTLARMLAAGQGDTDAACEQLPRWVRARGMKLPGLVTRRAAERDLCIHGEAQA